MLLALRPCWMASPLSVSQLLPGDRPLLRRRHLRRGQPGAPGGRRHLAAARPPGRRRRRSAAAAADDVLRCRNRREEDDEDERHGGFRKHPRRDDVVPRSAVVARLALSQPRRVADRVLEPSNLRRPAGHVSRAPAASGIRHELVPHVPGAGGQEQSASREVQRVVELVLEHARDAAGTRRLGVITMGIDARQPHRERAVERAVQEHPELEDFFAATSGRAVLRQEPRAGAGRRARRDHPVGRLRKERGRARCRIASVRCSRRAASGG